MSRLLLSAAFVLFASLAAQASPYRQGGLEATQPWSRPAVAGSNGVGYLVVSNKGPKADVLTAVDCPLAARVEMHATSMSGGVMSMTRQSRIVVPAGGQVTFGPGGHHLMLLNLGRTIKAGDEVPATLVFASGARLKIGLKVGDGAGPPAAGHMAGMKH